jgi:hypothetical protein
LPHLDYGLQKLGPTHAGIAEELRRIDEVVDDLILYFQSRSVQVILLSEYGITPVDRPVHLNRLFRQKGWLAIKDELSLEILDCGASRVFAVADHQVAHIYLNDTSISLQVLDLLNAQEGVDYVLDESGKKEHRINHSRAGDFIAVADSNAWFTYYYWNEDSKAPDFARCVDIHRKPGYDPVELFLEPTISCPKLRVAWKLFLKKIGMRMLMDFIPLDAGLVRGSHGRRLETGADQPVLILPGKTGSVAESLESTEVMNVLMQAVLPNGSVVNKTGCDHSV